MYRLRGKGHVEKEKAPDSRAPYLSLLKFRQVLIIIYYQTERSQIDFTTSTLAILILLLYLGLQIQL
jgi:hypothetical protein